MESEPVRDSWEDLVPYQTADCSNKQLIKDNWEDTDPSDTSHTDVLICCQKQQQQQQQIKTSCCDVVFAPILTNDLDSWDESSSGKQI